jgi:thiol-disulfide isomerase/thioredoxin
MTCFIGVSRCGHCKTLAPIYEEVAEQLKGSVNVARVDVMKNRELGTRFDIQGVILWQTSSVKCLRPYNFSSLLLRTGFPTLKLLSKGNVYTFKGRRSVEEIVEFARGGYEMHEPERVPGELGYFGEIILVYKHAYKTASKDLLEGNYFTIDVFLIFMPFIFGFFLLLLICMPVPKPPQPGRRSPTLSAQSGAGEDAASSVPISNRARPPTSAADSANKKDD